MRHLKVEQNCRMMFDSWLITRNANDESGQVLFADILLENFGLDVSEIEGDADLMMFDRLIDEGNWPYIGE